MLVYKYRGGNDEIFKRDLYALEKNLFWSSKFEDLNDPFENSVKSDEFPEELNKAKKKLLECNKRLGVYSLSKSYNNELLWANYADSHKGFCVEYDLNLLLNNHVYKDKWNCFPVIYDNKIPRISIFDVALKNQNILQKAFGHKSMKWEHEDEYRIITDDSGIHNYDYEAVKSIYFGLKMTDYQKTEIINRLDGRSIKFFQIVKSENKYQYVRVLVKDIDNENLTYLSQIPKEITKVKPIKYKIFERLYSNIFNKLDIKVELESIISENEINYLANTFTDNLLQNAERIYIFYYLKSQNKEGIAWATSHVINKEISVSINEYSL